MRFNSAFKELKLLKTLVNGRLNNLNDPVLNVLRYKVAKERSVSSVDHSSIEVCSATIPCASGCTSVGVFVKTINNQKQSLHYSIQIHPSLIQFSSTLSWK